MADKPGESRPRLWAKRALIVFAIAGSLIFVGWLGAAFIPRWWAHAIGGQVNGSIAAGIMVGLFYGFVFTGLPLLILWWTFGRRRPWKHWLIGLLIAVLIALPNLFTLGIILGSGNAAHAGERTLDVDAPGFRGGALAGAIIAAVAVVLLAYLLTSGRHRSRRLDALEQRLKAQERAEKARIGALPEPAPPEPQKQA